MLFREAGSGVDLDFIPLPDNEKFTGRPALFPPIRWNGLFGGGDASFLIWLVMGMPNHVR